MIGYCYWRVPWMDLRSDRKALSLDGLAGGPAIKLRCDRQQHTINHEDEMMKYAVHISYLLYSMRRIINFTPVKISPGSGLLLLVLRRVRRQPEPHRSASACQKCRRIKTLERRRGEMVDDGAVAEYIQKRTRQHTNVCHLEWPLVTVSCRVHARSSTAAGCGGGFCC